MLWLVQRIFYGPENAMTARPVDDLRVHEWAVLAPLAVLMLVMGVAPTYWLRSIEKSSTPAGIGQQSNRILGPTWKPGDPSRISSAAADRPGSPTIQVIDTSEAHR